MAYYPNSFSTRTFFNSAMAYTQQSSTVLTAYMQVIFYDILTLTLLVVCTYIYTIMWLWATSVSIAEVKFNR